MGESRLAALFLTILAAGTAMVVAMVALLVQFTDGAEEAAVWRSLIVAMAGAGVGLSVTAIVHLSLIASRRSAYLRREARVVSWTEAWCAVAAGADTPTVKPVDTDVAAEGAALVLQDLTGEGAQRIRQALRDGGVIEAELSLATRGLLGQAGDSTAALGRLAWIAVPEALPLFEVASTGSERASRAALLGVMRVLAEQRKPEQVGSSVVLAIEEHVTASRDPEATRPYLTAVMMAAGENLPWLCRELLGNNETACVHVAALDAMGRSHRPEAGDIATTVLLGGSTGETKAAALRTLAQVGHVPPLAVKTVVKAASDEVTAVRVNAAYALVGVGQAVALPTLWHGLADPAWEVRRASADALLRYGRAGEEVLWRASEHHKDRFARDVSTMVLGVPTRSPAEPATANPAGKPAPASRTDLPLIGDVVVRGQA